MRNLFFHEFVSPPYKLEFHVGIGLRGKDRFRWTDRGTYTKELVDLNGSKLLFFLLLFWKTER